MDDKTRLIQILENQMIILLALEEIHGSKNYGKMIFDEAIRKCIEKTNNLMPLYAEDELPED